MKVKDFFYYVYNDIKAKRNLVEVFAGGTAIMIATLALLIIISFTNGTYRFIDTCFHRVRPIIGTIPIRPKSQDLVTISQHEAINLFCNENSSEIDGVSWISRLDEFRIYTKLLFSLKFSNYNEKLSLENNTISEQMEETFASLDYTLSKNSTILRSKDNEWKINDSKRNIEYNLILVNETLLVYSEKYNEILDNPIVWSVPYNSEIFDPKYGMSFLLPPQIGPLKKDKRRFGIWMNISFLKNLLQFPEEEIKKIVVKKDFSNVPKVLGFRFSPVKAEREYFNPGIIEIPILGFFDVPETYPDLITTMDIAGAYFYLNKQKWEPSYTLQFFHQHNGLSLLDPQKYNFSLDKKELEEVINENEKKIYQFDSKSFQVLAEKDELLRFESLKTKGQTPYREGIIWIKEGKYKEQGIRSKVIQKIENNSPLWYFSPSSTSVSQALNRIISIVTSYSLAIITIVFVLCGFSTFLFGINHVHRKRKDIGILKACGIKDFTVAKIFIAQVTLVSVLGFLLGVIAAYILSIPLEQQAKMIIYNLQPEYTINERILTIEAFVVSKAFLCIFFASFIGSIVPTYMASKVSPLENLNTSL